MVATGETSVAHDDGPPTRTPLVLFWALTTLIWSIFTPPHFTFAARLLLFQPAWALRIYMNDATWVQDLALFLLLHAIYSNVNGAWRLLTIDDLRWLDLNNQVFQLYLKVFTLLGTCGLLAGGIVYRGHQLKFSDSDGSLYEDRIDEQLLPPLLITARTTHSRLFPKKHAFSYSYLLVGIPVGVRGRISKALSVETNHRSWFHVDATDYLTRGNSRIGLGEKLKRYLHTQNVTDREYSFAYLVTAPRFLGYSFNPVSFWYLYDSDTKLKYMILEVNNTFDERRMYLLKAGSVRQDIGVEDVENGAAESPKKIVFTDTWEKDFHVSPFNSRKGSYSLRALDPLAAYQETGKVKVDNTIVLRSSKEHSKIVARILSQGVPREADEVGMFRLGKFIAAWWWVGFLTFPRIVWEAQKLFFQRKLHVWYRPEIVQNSIGRVYTDDEKSLEPYFRTWLTHVVESAQKPLRLIYEPAHNEGEEVVLYSPGFTYEEVHRRTLTIQVLTPAFYSRFVHYAHAKEAFDRECLATEEKNRTISIQNPELLNALLDAVRQDNTDSIRSLKRQSFDKICRWGLFRRLRCPPPAQTYSKQQSEEYHISDIRSHQDSELDIFVKQYALDTGTYQRAAMKLFLAQRIAFGLPALITAMDWVIRSICLISAMYYSGKSDAGDILRPRQLEIADVSAFAVAAVLANSVHIWSFLKG